MHLVVYFNLVNFFIDKIDHSVHFSICLLITFLILNGDKRLLLSIGGRPYPGMDVTELVEKLRRGYRMEKPQHLDEKV